MNGTEREGRYAAVRRMLGVTLAAIVLAVGTSPMVREFSRLPDSLVLSQGQKSVVPSGLLLRATLTDDTRAVSLIQGERLSDVTLCAEGGGETSVTFSLLGLFPVHETRVMALEERRLIPGGQAVGVALKTEGVLVISRGDAPKESPLRVGDVILSAQGEHVSDALMLSDMLSRSSTEKVSLSVLRSGQTVPLDVPVNVQPDGAKRLGVWVRDSTAGIGTLSFIDPKSGVYGALGHAITDADTGSVLDVGDGAILRASIVGVARGESGKAGELHGSFLKENEQIGTLSLNSPFGIYGMMDDLGTAAAQSLYPEGLPIGGRSAVHTGPASIISTVDESGTKEYAVEIVRCFSQETPSQKGMVLRVTDSELLEKTGGIVQGMSGSPILQDGRIIGAVTHVYLNDSTMGYGMYIEWMLEKSDGITGQMEAA